MESIRRSLTGRKHFVMRARVRFRVRPGANTRITVSVRVGLRLGLG